MMLSQRKQEIMNILEERKSVRVQTLVDLLPVSPATIRRDIASLENDGLISRTRGEIHLSGLEHGVILPYATRSVYHRQEKSRIAKLAAGLVEDFMSVTLDSSSTIFFLAQELIERHLTVDRKSVV